MKEYRGSFQEIIHLTYPDSFNNLLAEIDTAFNYIRKDIAFIDNSKNPLDKRLEVSGYFLATIKVLDQKGESYDKIRELLIGIAQEYVRPKSKLQSFLKELPAKFVQTRLARILLKQLDKKTSKKSHPDGFAAKILTDKKETLGFGYGVDIIECGICKLFAKYNYQKYAPILCEVDYITSSLAGLKLIRTGTIAKGAKKCDFRFEEN